MRSGSRWWGAIVVAAGMTLVAACGSSAKGSDGGGGGGGAFHLGMSVDLSGPLAGTGNTQRAGALAYVKALNAAGGIDGHKVDLTVLDDAATTTRGVANTTKLITENKVSAVLGFSLSNVCAATVPLAKRYKTPLICQSLPDDLLSPAQDYLYSAAVGVSSQAAPMIAAAKSVNPSTKTVGLIYLSTAATTPLVNNVKNLAKKAGWRIVGSQTTELTSNDVGTQAAKLAAAKPDIIFNITKDPQAAPFVRAVQSAGYTGTVIGYSAISYTTLSAVKSDHLVIMTSQSIGDSKESGFRKFTADVKASGADPLQDFTPQGYLNAEVAGSALKACGYPCPGDKMNDALNKLSVTDNGFAASKISYSSSSHEAVHGMYGFTWDTATGGPKLINGSPFPTGH